MATFSFNWLDLALGGVLGVALAGIYFYGRIAKLKRSARAQSEFVAIASHQLRTPLSAVKWLIQPILEESTNLTPEQQQKLRDIYKSNERLINLINDLLSTTKLESGEFSPIRKPTDLKDLVETTVGNLQAEADMHKIKIHTWIGADLKKIRIDPTLFSEALKNILDNSIGFAPSGSVVDVTVSQHENNYVIGVHNDGLAVTEEERGKLFSKFYRSPVSKSRRPGGSGLGLFFSKAAVETLGGKIWFESPTNPDKTGITFYLSIPIS